MDAAISTFTELDFDEAAPGCRAALARHGFDILHESDLTATFSPGGDSASDASTSSGGRGPERVLVLGVSKPGFAARAYAVNKDVALLIPKNIVIREAGGGCVIQAFNPILLSQVVSGGLQDLAEEMATDLREIMKELTR